MIEWPLVSKEGDRRPRRVQRLSIRRRLARWGWTVADAALLGSAAPRSRTGGPCGRAWIIPLTCCPGSRTAPATSSPMSKFLKALEHADRDRTLKYRSAPEPTGTAPPPMPGTVAHWDAPRNALDGCSSAAPVGGGEDSRSST